MRTSTMASNRAKQISELRMGVKAYWESNKYSRNNGYRLKGKAGNKRSVHITSMKSYKIRLSTLKSGH